MCCLVLIFLIFTSRENTTQDAYLREFVEKHELDEEVEWTLCWEEIVTEAHLADLTHDRITALSLPSQKAAQLNKAVDRLKHGIAIR